MPPPAKRRSELVTLIDFGLGAGACCFGFEGGSRHSGTIRARRTDRGRVAVALEAWLGGADIAPGTRRELHGIRRSAGDDPAALLDAWAARCGRSEGARVGAPYQVGWCSWYYYFHGVTEAAFTDNLAHAADWPFTVIQLDDGYQRAIGDWLLTNEKFPSGVEGVAGQTSARGLTPGLWLAPFVAAPSSRVAAAHPEWFARELERDEPLMGMYHPDWGGVMWELDTTREDVLDHLASTSRSLVEMGYQYLKLDFTFSAAVPGRFSDPTRTPAERVRAGYDAVRAGAGNDAFILGCGCPLGAVIGSVDAMRIGPDVAPWWGVTAASGALPGYDAAAPSTRNAWVSTLGRSFMHRRLWLNDPDC
ncbi:MAG: Melibiase, partial [Actinomycetia bacterium]|nr:Melibiase [Actinomycetes bacterium]